MYCVISNEIFVNVKRDIFVVMVSHQEIFYPCSFSTIFNFICLSNFFRMFAISRHDVYSYFLCIRPKHFTCKMFTLARAVNQYLNIVQNTKSDCYSNPKSKSLYAVCTRKVYFCICMAWWQLDTTTINLWMAAMVPFFDAFFSLLFFIYYVLLYFYLQPHKDCWNAFFDRFES